MEFKNLFINIAITGVLILAIMSFIIITQQDNNPANLITNNTVINKTYGNLFGNISTAQSQGDSASSTFGNITPSQNFGIVDVSSVISPTRVFRALLFGIYNVLIELPSKILGVPPIVIGVINSILVLLIILGVWAIWRGVAS